MMSDNADKANLSREARFRRIWLRSRRRGMRELDILLGDYADQRLSLMSDEDMERFESFLGHNDVDLLQWVLHGADPPPPYGFLIRDIREWAGGRFSNRAGASVSRPSEAD